MLRKTISPCIMVLAVMGLSLGAADEKPRLSDTAAAYRASFFHMLVPTGAITSDREELTLRYQACDLAHEISFLGAAARLELTKDQAEKLLPAARKVRELCEERAAYIRDSATAYLHQCDIVRDNNILVVTGCDRDEVQKSIGKLEGMCSTPNYGLGRLDHPLREQFYRDVAAVGAEAEQNILTSAQREKLADAAAEINWVDLPAHSRRDIYSFVTDPATNVPMGTMGRMLLAPNAVAYLEKLAGQDASASIKRIDEFRPLAAEVQQLRRNVWSYAYRLVDGANIMSGMNFTEKQLTSLIGMLQNELTKIHAAHSEMNKKSLRPMVTLLAQMRDDVAAGKAVTDEQMQRVVDLQKQVCRGNYCNMRSDDGSVQYRGIFCPLHKDYTDAMEAVFKRLEDGSVIDVAQAKLLYETNQCDWLPPKNYRDPVRVGQAAKTIIYPQFDVITRLRAASDDLYAKQRDDFAAETVAGMLGPKAAAAAKEKEIARVSAALDEMRAMPDALYEMNKYSLLAGMVKRACPEKTSGTGAEHANAGDIAQLTWDTRFWAKGYDWSQWDFMRAMEKAGKPMPLFSEKPVFYGSPEYLPAYLQEWPAHFLMDPDFAPALKTMLAVVRSPNRNVPAILESLDRSAETAKQGKD